MAIFYQPEIGQGKYFLDPDESRHCIKVLRHQAGDTIQVQDGQGNIYEARITSAQPKQCAFTILSKKHEPPPPFYIHLAVAPTKNIDRLEWLVEKSVEIGVQEISFILCANSERRVLKLDRLEKKALSAMKQSKHLYLPKINELTSYPKFIKNIPQNEKFIAYVDFDNPLKLKNEAAPNSEYCILIGPEGDFTQEELQLAVEAGFKKVSLGSSRLRTETAGIVACHTLQMINDA